MKQQSVQAEKAIPGRHAGLMDRQGVQSSQLQLNMSHELVLTSAIHFQLVGGRQCQAVQVVWLPMIKLSHTVKQASGELAHTTNPNQLVPLLLVGHAMSATLSLYAGQATHSRNLASWSRCSSLGMMPVRMSF